MRTYIKHLTIALAAIVTLALGVGTGSARNLSGSDQTITVVWTPITFNGEGLFTVRCNVTLEGTFHSRTIAKVERSLVGLITRAIFGRPCVRDSGWAFNGAERNEALGNTTLPNSLPWHLTYERFAGTLPNISSITLLLLGARMLARVESILGRVLCIYASSAANGNVAAIAGVSGGVVGNITSDNSRRIRSETAGCPEGRFEGTGPVTVLNSSTRVTVTLI